MKLEQNRLCYYCYSFFFHYLNEHLKSIISTDKQDENGEISRSLTMYLSDNWIYKRLEAADAVC